MAFSVNSPMLLLLIPAAVAFVVFTSRRMLKYGGLRKRLAVAFRIILFVLVIAAIAGIGIKKSSTDTTTIFVLDISDSMAKAVPLVESFMEDALKSKKPSEKAGMVSFGKDAAVEFSAAHSPLFTSVQSKVNGNFTNIEQGLKLASSLIPAADKKRMVLITDGLENSGDSIKQARALRQQGITLDVFPVPVTQNAEVQVKEISVPENLHMNEKFEIVVKTDSTVKTTALLKLFSDKVLVAQREIEIQEGENNFTFSDEAKKGGIVTYTAVIEPVEDTVIKNNSMSAFSNIGDVARILVVQDNDEAGSELVKMLEDDIKIDVSNPSNLPVTIDELQKYDGFIISNVSAEKFDNRFLENLERSIKYQGKGLLVTGGENSYAPGGYYETVLEKVLPVNMDIKPEEEMPSLGLVLVIDKSGSMSEGQYGVSKVELAKEAAIRSTEVLSKQDMIGVIAFDSVAQWVVKTQKPDNLQSIQDAIGTIRAGGGTSILPPLREAYLSLKDVNTKLKHIILLTDGQAEKTGYMSLIEDMNKEGITMSTVAVGSMADVDLLKALAFGGKGRFYMTDEFTDIPKIFAKETFLAGQTYLNNRTFTPNLRSYSEILRNIDSIPPLNGYVGTRPKNTAKVIFSSDREDPVLATWQYGLGKTAAWTSDAKGMWTSEWLSWEQSPQFWKNLVSWLLQQKSGSDFSIKGSIKGGTGELELQFPPEESYRGNKVEAVMIAPSGVEERISLEAVSPGYFKGTFDADETGVYIASITIKNNGDTVKFVNSGINIPYSPEYNISRADNEEFLKKLAHEGGGRIIKNPGEVFSGELAPVESVTDITPILLSLAIILFLVEIAVRRLNIPFDRLIRSKFIEKAGSFAAAAKIMLDSRTTRDGLMAEKPREKEQGETKEEVEVKDREEEKSSDTLGTSLDSHISILLEKKRKRDKSGS